MTTTDHLSREDLLMNLDTCEAERQDDYERTMRLCDILTRTANALKGEPRPGVSHSWHDLPEIAAQMRKVLKPFANLVHDDGIEAPHPEELWWRRLRAAKKALEN